MKGRKPHGNEQGFRGSVLSACMMFFTLTLFRLYRRGGAADHLRHQRINHQYRDGLD